MPRRAVISIIAIILSAASALAQDPATAPGTIEAPATTVAGATASATSVAAPANAATEASTTSDRLPEPASTPEPAQEPAAAGASSDVTAAVPAPAPDLAFELLGKRIEPGTRIRVSWRSGATFIGDPMHVPITVIHGIKPGPVLCLTGAIHGDELNGVEVIRRVLGALDPSELVGTVVGVPIVNMAGFSRGSRYLPDRRDLNRFFPGNLNGSSASRIAHDFFDRIARRCDAIVDFHTGSFDRSNLPQVRGDMRLSMVVELTRGFGATSVLHTPGAPGMLRRAATDAGIPAVTFELGAPVRLEPVEIEHGVTAIETLMNNLGMTQRVRQWREPQPIFYESRWVRVMRPGMLFTDVKLGDRVRQGQRLGRVINPLNDETSELVAPVRGRVLGMALNQVVLPGYAAFHVGEEASEAQVIRDAARALMVPDETESIDEGATSTPVEGSTEQVEEYAPEVEGDANE
ncbi:MAG TPA: succinylglutamate desuccinylase/aspartoacylase family protein [Xanthomonadales bacterium]|nr:succinylglutamate desuccinylase/aspartoacylase family protein [Xanthomonadales bacterium]